MHRQDEDNYLIGQIIYLMNYLQENHLDIEQFMDCDNQENPPSFPELQDFQSAYKIVKFMDEMPGGFLIYYAEGTGQIIYANRALLRTFQCKTMAEFREFTGNSFWGMVHPEDCEAVRQSIRSQISISQYDLDYVEYRIIRKDGTVRWMEDYGHFIRNGLFKDIFYVFIGDATEKHIRQLAERENLIKEYNKERDSINQEYLRRLEVIEGLSVNYESIFYVNLDDDQMLPYRLSRRSESFFNQRSETGGFMQFLTEYVTDWVFPEDREIFRKATEPDYIREKLAEYKTYYINYRISDNEEIQYLQLRVVNVGRQNQVSQIVMGYRRVDEELQQEMEQKQLLAEALDNATQAIRVKDTFLSNMSHDMRTPLNAIFGFTTLAKQNCQNPEIVRNYLDRIETSSKQLLELINKVLELSQSESGQTHTIEVQYDLCSTIKEVYDFLLPQTVDKGIHFTLDCSHVTHRVIYGDQEKLKHLVLYLANNAVTYTKTGGRVGISVVEQEELPNQFAVYQLVVEDTGIGISEDFLTRIFEPFAREKNTTLSGIHGIGLGLTIAKNIVNMMGGTIDVKSKVNEGSTFTITLRFRIQPSSFSVPSDEPEQDNSPKTQRILLVEDNEINLEIETEILQDLGFDIDSAVNGKIAVDKLRQATPGEFDLVLMDIQMPVMDGWQAAEEIRRLDNPKISCIPIIALSANVFESDIRKSIESGMNAHIPKPLDVGLLMETIEKITKTI